MEIEKRLTFVTGKFEKPLSAVRPEGAPVVSAWKNSSIFARVTSILGFWIFEYSAVSLFTKAKAVMTVLKIQTKLL